MDSILKSGLIKILDDFIIGRSNSYPCGWINTDDLRKIADMIDNGKYDKFGNEVCEYDEWNARSMTERRKINGRKKYYRDKQVYVFW